jgi:hypothetical protein
MIISPPLGGFGGHMRRTKILSMGVWGAYGWVQSSLKWSGRQKIINKKRLPFQTAMCYDLRFR